MNVQIRKKSMENQLTYQIVKVYIRCTDSPDMENAWVRKRQNPSTCKQFIQKKKEKKEKEKAKHGFLGFGFTVQNLWTMNNLCKKNSKQFFK